MNYSQCHVFCRRFSNVILSIAVILLCSIIYGIYHYGKFPHAASTFPDVCHSNECLRSAAGFKRYMDPKIDPCEDFYGYVCGNWADDHPRLVDGNQNNWFAEGRLKINRSIRDRLERNVASSDPKPVQQAKIMYQSCVGNEAYKNESASAITKYLLEFGLPMLPTMLNHTRVAPQDFVFDWIATVAKIKRKIGLNVLIGFNLETDGEGRNRLTLEYSSEPPLLTFPTYEWKKLHSNNYGHSARLVKKNESDDVMDAAENAKLLLKLAETINPGFDGTGFNASFSTLGKKFADFAEQLQTTLTRPNSSTENLLEDYTVTYYTVQELQNITDTYIAPNKPYPIWQHYLEELFAPFPEVKPTQEDKLKMSKRKIASLKRLVMVISRQPLQVVELYIWKTVVMYMLEHKFNKLNTEEDCAGMVRTLMGLAVNYMFADTNFLNDTKPRVEQMVNGIRDEFNQMVLEADWMDAVTKNATVEKSNSMKILIGFPEWLQDVKKLEEHYHELHIEKNRHFKNWVSATEFRVKDWLQTWRTDNEKYLNIDPMILNAYYISKWHAMYIPVAYIQYPAYFLGLEALNYGALGKTLGHELTHGFDHFGIFFDKLRWSNHTVQEYDKRADCFVEQYSKYHLADAEGFVNGDHTLNENIADNGGIREAFRAYQAYVKRNGAEPKLPGFEHFTHEQLFFISFSHELCSAVNPAKANELLLKSHSPLEIRVKGTLSNMPEFSEAFHCPVGKPMNPENKCRIW